MMPTIAMATSRQSTARSLHPDTLGWLTENDPWPVVGWSDQVIDALGHDPRSEYVEIFWLPIIVPSCTLAARRLPAWLDAESSGFKVSVRYLASSLGLGSGGRNSGEPDTGPARRLRDRPHRWQGVCGASLVPAAGRTADHADT